MKNTKLTRIFVLILSLALLVGSAIGIAASAEETDTYAIKAINIAHGDRTQILIAVDAVGVDESEIEVKYTVGGTTKVANFYDNIDIYGDGNVYPVYYTAGIAAKDCGQAVVAEAHKAGATPAAPQYKNVSVADYLFGKLYKEGFITATEGEDLDKKNLYLEFIEYIASAEEVLWNMKPENADKQRTLLTDVNYVYVKEGGAIKGADTAILKADGFVTVTPDKVAAGQVWKVDSYDSQGKVTTTYAEGNRVPVTSNSVITAVVDPCVIDFENATVGTWAGTLYSPEGNGYIATNAGSHAIAQDEVTGNKTTTYTKGGTYYWFWWNNRSDDSGNLTNDSSANVAVLEFDVDFRQATAGTYESLDIRAGYTNSGAHLTYVTFGYKDAANGYVINLGSTVIKTGLYGTGDNHAEKFTFRMEYMWSTGAIKFSINGKMVYLGTIAASGPIARNYYTGNNPEVYVDNVKAKNTYVPTLEPEIEYEDFSGEYVSDPQSWTTTRKEYVDEITNDAFAYGGTPSEMGYDANTVFTADKYTFGNIVVSYAGDTRVSASSIEVVTEADGNKYLQLNNAARISTRDRSYGMAVAPDFVHTSLYYFDFDFKVSAGTASFILYTTAGKYCQWEIKAPDAGGLTFGGVSVPGARNEWVSFRVVFDLSEAAPEFKVYTKGADGEYAYACNLPTTNDSAAEGYVAATDTTKLSGGTVRDISMASTESRADTTLCFDNVALYTVAK